MNNHWQPISEGTDDVIGIIVDGDKDWIKPVIQTKTKDISTKSNWDVNMVVLDPNTNRMLGNDKESFVKTYYFKVPQTHSDFKKFNHPIDDGTKLNMLITVRLLT